MEDNIIFIKVRKKIQEDIAQIEEMINASLSAKEKRVCPLYQDVIDTQIYGLSKEINLAVEIGCMTREAGKQILSKLEEKSADIYSYADQESKAN